MEQLQVCPTYQIPATDWHRRGGDDNFAAALLAVTNQDSINAQGIVGAVNDNGRANINTTQAIGLHTDSTIQRSGQDLSSRVERFGLHLDNHIHHGFDRTNDNLFRETELIKLRLCDTEHNLAMQAEKHAAAAALAAATNTAALQAALAECCCEMRQLVTDKAAATDALILKLDNDRVRDALADAKAELLALRATCR